jgi:ankyrin repeat protein
MRITYATPDGNTAVTSMNDTYRMPLTIHDPNFQGPFGNTLLHSAVVSGDIDEVQRLLAAGADPRIRNRDGKNAMHAAALLGHAEIERLLGRHVGGG